MLTPRSLTRYIYAQYLRSAAGEGGVSGGGVTLPEATRVCLIYFFFFFFSPNSFSFPPAPDYAITSPRRPQQKQQRGNHAAAS